MTTQLVKVICEYCGDRETGYIQPSDANRNTGRIWVYSSNNSTSNGQFFPAGSVEVANE